MTGASLDHANGTCAAQGAAVAFARELVAGAAPVSAMRAKALVFAASRLAAFAQQIGLELVAERVLCEATVERFVLEGCARFSPATRRTLRSNLRSLARALERYPQPPPLGLGREQAKAPYSQAQIEGFLRLAACQSTLARRMRASALVCLGAGAGIITSELRHVRGVDVARGAGGVLVIVSGPRARSVPVLERYHERLLAAAAFAGEGYITGGRDPGRRNLTDALSAALSADPGLPALESGRLRCTWLCECAGRIGLGVFMQAAGIRCSQRLGDLAAQLPAATAAELVALLGGAR